MSKIKYGLIGFGGIAESRIAKEGFACDTTRFSALENAELIGATDINPARKEAAEALGLKWYDSAEAMLADPEIQAVFVATNNLTHAALATAALEAGKPTIVEKPIATTVEDAEKLCLLAKEKGLSLNVDHMMTKNAYNQKARAMVADGTLGEVNDGCFHMEFAYGYDDAEAATWRCSNWDEIGGPIGDVASHAMYMAEFIFGSTIEEVCCVYYPKVMPIKVEDGAYVRFKLANGITASAKAAFCEYRGGLGGTLSNLGYELYGSEAVLRGYATLFQLSGYDDEPVPVRLELDKFSSQEKVTVDQIQNIYQGIVSEHAQSIINGKPLTGCDAVHNLQLVAACHESARNEGKIIKVGVPTC
jgi:predicted dehydrogenase